MKAIAVRHYGPGGLEAGGGIGRVIGYIVAAAAERGAVHAVCDTRGPRWSLPGSSLRLLAAMGVMARDRLLAPGRVHHIHLAGRGSTLRKLALTAVARRLGCRHVLHLHDYDYGTDLARRSPRLRALVGAMFRGADAVIVLGQRDRDLAAGALGVAPDRLAVLHNGVPDPGPRDAPPAGDPLIVFLGRLSERKGVPELLRALAGPEMAALRWRAVLAGDGPVEAYRQAARDLGLGDRVEMPGWLDAEAASALCREAEILALPSQAEGMAMAVLEGLAHGLAVVTTRVGAHEEVVTDGVTGLFVPVGDDAALGQALAALLRDEPRRRALGQRARALFLSRFGMGAYMARLDAIHEAARAAPPRTDAIRETGA
jgi:glycosyltransferase involved in cell wall biosynthesis